MHPLLIEVDGRVLRFEGDRPVRIGRSIDADVVLPASSVSRNHAELRPSPQGWVLADVGSAGGTFVDGAQVQEQPLSGRVSVQCGPAGPGTTLTITPESQAAPEMSAASHAPASTGYDATVIAGAPALPAPGMPAGPVQPPTGPDLLIVAEGLEHRFRHPAEITVGRLPECDIVVDDPAASRRHARIVAQPGGWSFENHSQAGSFVNGRPVHQLAFDEKTEVRLGHPVAGEKLELVPILSAEEEVRRFAARRRKRHLMRAGIVAAALVLVFGGVLTAVLVGGGSEADSLTAEERERAMAATVLLSFEVEVAGQRGYITGSGSIIDDEAGLILTNAHVADPNADGLEEIYGPSEVELPDPDYIEVRLTDPDDSFRTGDVDYRAEVVTSDGSLDAAVIQIYADGDGDDVDPGDLDLPVMPLGDSDELSQGDPVSVLGFPGIARSLDTDPGDLDGLSLSTTSGVISTIINTERLGERSEFDTDARIAGGNSGGAAVDNGGRLIGVPSSIRIERSSPVVSGRIRPLELLLEMIEEAEQEAG